MLRIRCAPLLLTILVAIAALNAAEPASGQNLSVTDGTTQPAPGPSYAAIANAPANSALYAAGAGSTIVGGANLTLTSDFIDAYGAAAENGGTINLMNGVVITTTARAAAGLSTGRVGTGTIAARDVMIQTAGFQAHGVQSRVNGLVDVSRASINIAGDSTFGAFASTGTLTIADATIETSGTSSHALLSFAGGSLTADSVTLTTTGERSIGASAQFGGQLIVSGGSVSTTGAQAFGLWSLGVLPVGPGTSTASSLVVTGVTVTTSGAGAHGASAQEGGILAIKDSTIAASGAGAHALESSVDATPGTNTAKIENSTLTSKQGAGIGVTGTTLDATMTGTSVTGGAALLQVTESGILNLLAGSSTLTGAALTEGGGASNVVLKDGTVWTLTGDSHVTNLTNDASSILFTPPIGGMFKTLTSVNYVGIGGTLGLNTFLAGDGSPSDKLVIAGPTASATGSTSMMVTNAGGAGAQTVANGILVVEANSTTAPGAFSLAGPVVAGPYEYALFRGGIGGSAAESWFLRSTIDCTLAPTNPACVTPAPGPTPPSPPNFRQEVSLYAALPALALHYGRSLMDTLHQRVGEQEHLRGRTDIGNPITLNGAWGRVIAQHGNRDGDRVGILGEGPKYDFDFTALQAGFDVYRQQLAGGYRAHAGVYGALGDGRSDVTHFTGLRAGRDTFAAYTVGSYWTLFGPTGWYFDSVMQGTWYDMKGQSTRFPALETDGFGYASSWGVGVPLRFGGFFGGMLVEPQAQVVYQSVDLDTARDIGATVRFDDIDSLAGRIGVRFANTWAAPAGFWGLVQPGLVTAWFRPNYWHEFSGDPRTLFSSETGFIPFRADLGEAWVELNSGISARIDRTTELYANASYQFGVEGDSEAWGGKVGLRVNW